MGVSLWMRGIRIPSEIQAPQDGALLAGCLSPMYRVHDFQSGMHDSFRVTSNREEAGSRAHPCPADLERWERLHCVRECGRLQKPSAFHSREIRGSRAPNTHGRERLNGENACG